MLMKKLVPYIISLVTIGICLYVITITNSALIVALVSIPLNIISVLWVLALYDTVTDYIHNKKINKSKGPLGLIKKIKKHKFL